MPTEGISPVLTVPGLQTADAAAVALAVLLEHPRRGVGLEPVGGAG